jgi:N-acetylmuramoyl-L-alanine amidase
MRLIHFSYLILIVFLSSFVPSFGQEQSNNLPVAFSGSIAGDTASTRFFIDFDQNLSFKTTYMDKPNRVIIDLDESVFNLGEENKLEPRGLISAVQYGRISQGRSRIVLTLSAPVEIIKSSLKKRLDEESYRFLLDMDSTDEATFANLLSEQKAKSQSTGNLAVKGDRVAPVQKKDGRFTIVIDPGHGGIDGGAVGKNGAQEKDIVFEFSKVVRGKLQDIGPFDVLMTREEDKFMSLRDRLEFSRRSKADLFISIHADSLRQRFVRGSTIYTLSKKASDQLSAKLAETENSADLVGGLAVEEEVEAVADILVDLTTSETKRFSRRFSSLLVKNLGSEIKLIKNPQRSAAFGVLKAPEVPSVLIELGYLSNVEDERLLQSPEFKAKAGQAIANSVLDFFQPRMR